MVFKLNKCGLEDRRNNGVKLAGVERVESNVLRVERVRGKRFWGFCFEVLLKEVSYKVFWGMGDRKLFFGVKRFLF